MLTDFWRDIISIGGFLLTLAGLAYAIRQVWLAKSAADAAKRAAERSLAESRRSYQRYVIANAHRLMHEVKIHAENEEWLRMALRLEDLADQVVQFAPPNDDWNELARQVRWWADMCSRLARKERTRFLRWKWREFCLQVQGRIAVLHSPFALTGEDSGHDS